MLDSIRDDHERSDEPDEEESYLEPFRTMNAGTEIVLRSEYVLLLEFYSLILYSSRTIKNRICSNDVACTQSFLNDPAPPTKSGKLSNLHKICAFLCNTVHGAGGS
jgi:hypothetical protein